MFDDIDSRGERIFFCSFFLVVLLYHNCCTCLIEHARLPGLGTTGLEREVDCRECNHRSRQRLTNWDNGIFVLTSKPTSPLSADEARALAQRVASESASETIFEEIDEATRLVPEGERYYESARPTST